MSYLIADRRREFGVRLALGAQHGDIVRLVLRASVGMAVVGIAIGEIATALAARWVAPYLFDTSARDPLVYTATAAVLVIVALGAALVPARRARAVNPIEALRSG
jgi:ABC-type antimicrobial peptide transport system permease subunit